jgi:putative SOS response-associated peptidase YedK
MCGRYVITSQPDALRALFGYDGRPDFPARYNIAPTQPVPVIRINEGRCEFALVRWGFIPAWVKDPGTVSVLFNARSDSVLDKPAFRNAIRRRRCLFPADGFYEWKREGARNQSFFIKPRDGQPMAFAGIWESWSGPNGEDVETAAIITTDANSVLQSIHPRMPAIVPTASFDAWLDCANVDAATALTLIGPAPDAALEAYPVSTAVNRAANDSAQLIAPLAVPVTAVEPPTRARKRVKDDGQASLF